MFKFGCILIFVHFWHIFNAQEPITLLNSSITTDAEAANVLVEIQPNQVLPLVLINEYRAVGVIRRHAYVPVQQNVLELPNYIEKAVTINQRMVNGTQFFNYSKSQSFFCPKSNSEEKCLAIQEFQEFQLLECAKEPIPVIHVDPRSRGPCGSNGVPYYVAYDICPNEAPYEYVTEEIPFYGFCYNTTERKTIFTSILIPSPDLLNSKLLFRERSVNYPIVVDDEYKPSNLDQINITLLPNLDLVHPEKPSYKLQMLVPEANMALALWRKTTYKNFNLEWMHKTLIPLWNQINHQVRSIASELFESAIKIIVRTGVIDINPGSENYAQMSNVWVNMIVTLPSNVRFMAPVGVVIFMNNFIGPAADAGSSSTTLNEIKEIIDGFCQEDVCIDAFKEEFNKVGGHVRCCSLLKGNVKVRELFDFEKGYQYEKDIEVIQIPGITFNN